MAGGAARLRAGSAGPGQGHGARFRTTPRGAPRSGYPVPSAKGARPVQPVDTTPLQDLLEVCGSSLHNARGSRPSTAGAVAFPPRTGVPKGPQRSNSFRGAAPQQSPAAKPADVSTPIPVAEPVCAAPRAEPEVEVAAEPEQTENEDPWAQRLARLERIRLGLASVSTERPWAMPRPATGAPASHRARGSASREVRSAQSTAGQRQCDRPSGCKSNVGGEVVLEGTEAEAAAVLAAAMSDAELQAGAAWPAVASRRSAGGNEALYQPQQPLCAPELPEPHEQPEQFPRPVDCWFSPSAASGVATPSPDEGDSPRRPLPAQAPCTPASIGCDLLSAEVLYDSVVESSCSSISWPLASARTGKGVGEACAEPLSGRLPEPAWSVESTVAATPDLVYRSGESMMPYSVEAGLSVASSPSVFADISSGRSVGAFACGESCHSSPTPPQHSNEIATMCLHGKAYGPSTSSAADPGKTEADTTSSDDAAKLAGLKERTNLDSELCCQGQAIAFDIQPQTCWHSMQSGSKEELCRPLELPISMSSGAPLLVHGHSLSEQDSSVQSGCLQEIHKAVKAEAPSSASQVPLMVQGYSVGDPEQGGPELGNASKLRAECCLPTESSGKLQTAEQGGFHSFLDELRDLRSEARSGPADHAVRAQEREAVAARSEALGGELDCVVGLQEGEAAARRVIADLAVPTLTDAISHQAEASTFSSESSAPCRTLVLAAERDQRWQVSEAEPAALPVSDGSIWQPSEAELTALPLTDESTWQHSEAEPATLPVSDGSAWQCSEMQPAELPVADGNMWQSSRAGPAALPVTDGSALLELQQFLRRAGVEDLLSVICAHAADNLEALLALPAPVIRRIPAQRARLQRLLQALTTERGRRMCSWVAERNDVLRSQDVVRRASSVQRGTSNRRGTNRSQCTPTANRFQPGPRTRKAGASQPRSGEPLSRSNACPRPGKTERRDSKREQFCIARPLAPGPLMDPLAGPTQADGCDDAGFFITCLEGADAHPNLAVSALAGSAQAQTELFCPPTRSSSSTAAPSSAPASSAASAPSAWIPSCENECSREPQDMQKDAMDTSRLEQPLQPTPSVQSQWTQISQEHHLSPAAPSEWSRTPSAEPLQLPFEAPQLPPRIAAGLAEQVLQAALPSSRPPVLPSAASSRPQTRQARIRQLLQHVIEVAPCPMEAARVDARQQQAYERHLRLRSRSPGGRRGNDGQAETAPSSLYRRSRSLMDLVSEGPTLLELSMADPPGWRPRRGPACPDPVPGELLDSLLDSLPTVAVGPGQSEPCTICLDVPEPGEIVTTLSCCHWYHRECIREWLTHSRLCPLCKASALPQDVS